jgi:hypothetical protein
MEARIAWCDKKSNSYLTGHWRSKYDISIIHAWATCQNMIRRNEYYWVEIKEDGKITNYIEVEKPKSKIEKEYVEIDYKDIEKNK